MNPEILAKIMGIIAKTGDRVIVIDSKTGIPFALMSLDQYEKLILPPKPTVLAELDKPLSTPLTAPQASGMIDPAIPPWIKPGHGGDDWGGNEEKDEDRYYMEPTE